jgi:tetratricopeptide (TPR) repeat protein
LAVNATKSAASRKKSKTASRQSSSPARISKAAKKTAKKAVKKPARKKAAPKAAKKPAREAAVRKKTTGKAAGKKVAREAPAKKAARKAPAKKVKKPARGRIVKPARGRIVKKVVQPSEEAAVRSRKEAEEYQLALTAYGTCLELLQKRDWEGASRALADFGSHHGRESELAQRARTYLRVCAQHLDSKSVQPKDFNDRCYTALILANKGEYKEALTMLDEALQERPRSSKAHYLKASTLALMGERRGALDALKTAIEMEDRNRIYAANNPDFAGLRDDEEFITLTTREDEEY